MTPFKLYTDKASDFECEIEIEGAKLSEATARLVLTSDKKSVLYEGKITKDGKCKIDIPRTKGLFEQKESGEMALEIIVEDEAYFRPWEGDFTVDTARKVNVKSVVGENTSPPKLSKPVMKVTVKEQVNPYELRVRKISEFLDRNGINSGNVLGQKRLVFEAINRVFKGHKADPEKVIRDIIIHMSNGDN